MPVFVYRDGRMVDKSTGEPMISGPCEGPFPCPQHVPDISPYLSPVDGRYVAGRKDRRDDLARHGCIDANELPRPTGGKLRNRRFAQKHGLEHMLKEEARE